MLRYPMLRPKLRGIAPKRQNLEHFEQVVVAQWLDTRKVLWTHPPNGELRDIRTAARLKRAGVSKGVPDIIIFDAPRKPPIDWPPGKPCCGAAIELKATKGGSPSAEQKLWLAALEQRGWAVKVAKGAGQAIAWLVALGF